MQVTRLTDFIYAYRLLNIIQKPWAEQEAYKYGIIDAEGKNLRKFRDLRTAEEKNSFSYFHRLAFNMKRMLSKVPGFENKIVQTAMAMKMLKEDSTIEKPFTDEEIQFIGQKLLDEDTPTNVTGSAVSTNIERPLQKKQSMVRRNPSDNVNSKKD